MTATMTPDAMTPEAKSLLAATIRGLRAFLIGDGAQPGALHHAVEGAYRMSLPARDAGLSEVARGRRERLEAWIDEQVRIEASAAGRARFRAEAEKRAAYTLVNRIVILRLMEARRLREPAVVTRGWESAGYKAFRQLAPALRGDETEGYALLLQLVFDDLAVELPGLFGAAGVAALVPTPPAALRHVIEALDRPELATCWTDDMTLGWVYQYWNDPEREALDAKLDGGGLVEAHEIASKTQMFTERYLVDWLLQNSLGPIWLAICKQHGWTPDVERDGVLEALRARRAEWRGRREAGEVSPTALMPLRTELERRWAYYLPRPVSGPSAPGPSAPEPPAPEPPAPEPPAPGPSAPGTVRELKILDPAVGSGHFLVVAFELLFAMYLEEARHRGAAAAPDWQPKAIAESILEHNLHGIDLDPRAVQIAAAALWIKARQAAAGAAPRHLNLVASALRLAELPDDDPGLRELRGAIERGAGLPASVADAAVQALRGADHLGSLLRIDRTIDEAIAAAGGEPAQARAAIWRGLEQLLGRHTRRDELGLRLGSAQLAAGVRFVRLIRDGAYDLVVGNPPYLGAARMTDASYLARHYPRSKSNLYAAFLERGLELARPGGTSALLTMRDWMFITQYAALRQHLLETFELRALGDFDVGAFEEVGGAVVSVVASVLRAAAPSGRPSLAQRPTPDGEDAIAGERTRRKRAATLAGVGVYELDPQALRVVPRWPLIYWWSRELLDEYACSPLIGATAPVVKGLCTGDDLRFTRRIWEVDRSERRWKKTIKGGKGRAWIEPALDVVDWDRGGLIYGLMVEQGAGTRLQNRRYYFRLGVAFSMIGAGFCARAHHYPSIFGDMGSSVFPEDLAAMVVLLNSARARRILESLNPGMHFQVGDVNRLPLAAVPGADEIFQRVQAAFLVHEAAREPSIEFRAPGPSPWRHAQRWAQAAADRPDGAPLPAYAEELDPEPATDHLSFALGVALGRLGAGGEGILDPRGPRASAALPAGICFLDGTLDAEDRRDSLGEPACGLLHERWAALGAAIDGGSDLRTWLRTRFFADVHRGMYDGRPIYWPLSSEKKTFVAWVSIHRMDEHTLRVLRADHLEPARRRLDGERADLRAAQGGADRKAAKAAEKRLAQVQRALEELARFIDDVEACAERGAPPTDPRCPPRERDARHAPELDDGVMINSAALWPLLDPQWSQPRQWWRDLATAEGKKDHDWSRLAMRYWPARVGEKCRRDPSLAVAHGCFWRHHPARAWAWELRMQDELGPGFRIEERDDAGGDAAHRARYLEQRPDEARAAIEKEALRRSRRQRRPQLEDAPGDGEDTA